MSFTAKLGEMVSGLKRLPQPYLEFHALAPAPFDANTQLFFEGTLCKLDSVFVNINRFQHGRRLLRSGGEFIS